MIKCSADNFLRCIMCHLLGYLISMLGENERIITYYLLKPKTYFLSPALIFINSVFYLKCIYVLRRSQNKERLILYTALTYLFL
jgi:TctA family transporter